MTPTNTPPPYPTLTEAAKVWAKVAALSFGGPAGQIATMHRMLVEERRWLGERRFLHALNYCMLLPGPEAQQLAIYIGWLMHRTAGGVIAGALFVLPGFIAIMGLSVLYALYGRIEPVAGLFFGLKAAVLVVVAQALIRVARRSLRNPALVGIAGAAFLALFLFGVPFPWVILAAGLTGATCGALGVAAFQPAGHGDAAGPDSEADTVLGDRPPAHARSGARAALIAAAAALALWLAPVLVATTFGRGTVFADIAWFFSKMAVVTFGGAYAVLAYVAQEAVRTYGWLQPGEMLDGLGLAETTPGPLIIVNQFVGFLGAYRHPGGLAPLMAGVIGGVLTTWVTFTPSFLWIFLGAPFAERLRGARALNAALSAIGAAVVGVICNLALWFALHALFQRMLPGRPMGLPVELPDLGSLNPWSAGLTLMAAIAAFRFRLGMIPLLAASSVAGAAIYLLGRG